MFTGIIKEKSRVVATGEKLSIKRVAFETLKEPVLLGESISINGVCSTVAEITEQGFIVEYMPETLSKTTMKNTVSGDIVNIERSLKVGDALDGHFVYGHVDTVEVISKIKKDGYSKVFEISLSKDIASFIAPKGSVTLDGVSLTISKVNKQTFEVSLIPFTLEHTILGDKKVGDLLNIEVDILARYILRK